MENIPKLHIAFLDDDRDNHLLMAEALSEVGHSTELILFESGIKLLQYLSDKKSILPQLIFLDINMLILDGKQCLRSIRTYPMFKEIAIIMLSTSSSERDIEETFSSGANRYIIKPFCFNDQVTIIRKVIEAYYSGTLMPNREEFVLSSERIQSAR